tara:strand:- start:2103 stop:3173 length:1071 start_codon:yes stop_codon:yes gene_type:complete
VKYLFLIHFYLIINSLSFLQAKDANYDKLKEVEEKLLSNKEIYLELLNVEKEIKKSISKANSNVKKYKQLIKKGYSEKLFLEQSIEKKNQSLIEILSLKESIKSNKSLLLTNVLISKFDNSYSNKKDSILRIILESYHSLYNNYNEIYIETDSEIKKYQVILSKLNNSLNNIESSLKNKSNDLEGLIAETIITEIEKQKNILQKNKIQKKANKIKSLIEKFESNSLGSKLFGDFKFNQLQDILPLKKMNIKRIYTEKLNTGINLSVISDTKLIAPKNSLVVYADFFRGYGNMIILDLGNEYHLILSGLSNIKCKTGDWLEKGMILGDINVNNNNNFYMEFRFKGKTIRPNKWAKIN